MMKIDPLRIKKPLAAMFIVSGALSAVLCLIAGAEVNIFVLIIPLAMISTAMIVTNMILMAVIPLNYSAEGRVSSVAGFMDFSAYLGAAASSPVIGYAAQSSGWRSAMIIWCAVSVTALIILIILANRPRLRR